MPEIACINGNFMPLERATIHVEDRGVQFADAVYEVMRTYGGRVFAIEEHLERLFRSLEAIELKHSFSTAQLGTLIAEALRQAQFNESVVYLQISRGHAPRHRGFPNHYEPTLILTVRERTPLPRALWENGVTAITVPDNRWGRCDIKSVALLANVLAYQAARRVGAHDAIFVEANESVTEATAGNIFIVRDRQLLTAPKGPRILSGVTRDKVIEAARTAGFVVTEVNFAKSQMLAADEVFLTSTITEVLPIVTIDHQKIGSGKPGPTAARIYAEFLRMFTRP